MIKNAIIYCLQLPQGLDASGLADMLARQQFLPCAPTQELSMGWVPPREENGSMVEAIGGHWIFRLQSEAKAVPGSVLTRKAKEKAALIFEQTGRRPGKKEMKEIKEELKLTLLPMAFSKISAVTAWFDPATGLLVLDTPSLGNADLFLSAMARVVEGFRVSLLQTELSAGAVMASWLQDADKLDADDRWGFEIGRACELWATDESKARVRYQNHDLDTDEVRQHIEGGKLPVKLQLTYRDRVTATLTQDGSLQKIEFEDVAFEGQNPGDAGGFDADVAIMTGELAKMLPELIEALGGEAQRPTTMPAAPAPLGDEADPLYAEAVKLVRASGKGSISYVQRHLQIGYNRAARLLEAMEVAGVLSPMASSGTRKVIGGAA